jgi:hypothetical protein
VRLSAHAFTDPAVGVVAAVAIVPATAAPITKALNTLRFFMGDILPTIAEIFLLEIFEFI